MLLIFASCTKEDTSQVEPAKMVDIAIVADTDATTRLGVEGNKTYWEVGDRITLGLVSNYYYTSFSTLKIESDEDISSDGKRATFRGTVNAGTYYGVAAIYPALANPSNNVTLDREAVDNIFMYSFENYERTPITVTSNTQLPISFSHLMHKMDFKLSLASGYQSDDLNSKDIVIEVSATQSNTPVNFPTTSTLNIRSGSLSTGTSNTSFLVNGSGSEFSTMLFPMNTMSNIKLTFGIYIDGEKRYEIVKGPLSSLKMSAGKSTKVNLVLSEDNSVSEGDDIVVEAITLSASKSTIKANGSDRVSLHVANDKGEDVTSQSTLYVNDDKLNGTTFSTITPGRYTIYAERNGVISNLIMVTAEAVSDTSKTIVFAEGVTLTSGWYDVNKKAQGNNGDINMCWAATSSNMIQWFQDRYKAAGKTLPEGATDGPGVTSYTNYGPYELELMNVFLTQWDNSRGGHMEQAIPWYFEGVLNGGEYASPGSQAVPLTDGGFWKSIWSDVKANMYCGYGSTVGYTTCYNNYYQWGNGTDLLGAERLAYFTDLVVTAFEHGMAGLTISLSANLYSLHHATTLWGYEIDNATGLLTRVWITDSDDIMTEPKAPLLNEYSVSIDEGKSEIKLTGNTRYGACWVVSLHPLSGYGTSASTTNL